MASPKHVISGLDYKVEAPLIMENIRELSDQMTLENLAGQRIKIDNPNGGFMIFGIIGDGRFGLLVNDGSNDRIFIGYESGGF